MLERWTRLGRWLRLFYSGKVNELVQLTTIEPDTATLWAVVELDALTFGHLQDCVVARAFHVPQPTANG